MVTVAAPLWVICAIAVQVWNFSYFSPNNFHISVLPKSDLITTSVQCLSFSLSSPFSPSIFPPSFPFAVSFTPYPISSPSSPLLRSLPPTLTLFLSNVHGLIFVFHRWPFVILLMPSLRRWFVDEVNLMRPLMRMVWGHYKHLLGKRSECHYPWSVTTAWDKAPPSTLTPPPKTTTSMS